MFVSSLLEILGQHLKERIVHKLSKAKKAKNYEKSVLKRAIRTYLTQKAEKEKSAIAAPAISPSDNISKDLSNGKL